ncbi:MAG: hypothetical protein ABR521_10855 [Gaiellaceae bacterium]
MENRKSGRSGTQWALLMALVLTGVLVGLELAERDVSEDAGATGEPPARVEPIKGTELSRVRLSQSAAGRLGLRTVPVRRRVVPYSSVLYDERGRTWVYIRVRPLTFVRARVSIDAIEGVEATLSKGPRDGVQVVSVGAAELYGAELGVDH